MARPVQALNTSTVYGRLVPIRDAGYDGRRRLVEFKCQCGNTTVKRLDQVRGGVAKSCGCLMREYLASGQARLKHNFARTRFYRIWGLMKNRTKPENVNEPLYQSWAGKGVRLCERWQVFENFRDDMYPTYLKHAAIHGERDTTIDRRNNNGGYSKRNCRWATYKVQANNRNYGKRI